MVEIFKTNVLSKTVARDLIARLAADFPDCKINFDLDDCDCILRVESEAVDTGAVVEIMQEQGFLCEVLD